jgi:hypothetical protein
VVAVQCVPHPCLARPTCPPVFGGGLACARARVHTHVYPRLTPPQYPAVSIPRSLSALGDVLEALDKKNPHVPYRNSKLTHLLQDSLSANSRTLMICAVSPTSHTADETHFTLQVCSWEGTGRTEGEGQGCPTLVCAWMLTARVFLW